MTKTSAAGRGRGGGHSEGLTGPRLSIGYCTVWLWAAVASGCQLLGQDTTRCDQSVATVRQAIGFKDFESARAWREYTWKVCDDSAAITALDKEIIEAEAAAAAEAKAEKEKAQKLAQQRINAAQKLWRAFDAAAAADRNQQALEATRKSAARLESGLAPTLAEQLRKYNEGEYQKRLAALKR